MGRALQLGTAPEPRHTVKMLDHWEALLIGIPVVFVACVTAIVVYVWLWQSQKVQRKEQLEGKSKAEPAETSFSRGCDKYQFMTMTAHIITAVIFCLVSIPALIDDNHDPVILSCVPVYALAELTALVCWIIISTMNPFEEKLEGHVCDKAYCTHCKGSYKGVHRRHCWYCNRCTTGYDHHCFFLNICVCRANYKQFMVLISSALVVNGLHTGIATYQIFRSFDKEEVPGYADEWFTRVTFEVFCSLQLLISGCSLVLLAILLTLHTYLCCIGLSTHQFLRRRYQEEFDIPIELPAGWARQVDQKGDEYFFSTKLGVSQWTVPEESSWEHTEDTFEMKGVDFSKLASPTATGATGVEMKQLASDIADPRSLQGPLGARKSSGPTGISVSVEDVPQSDEDSEMALNNSSTIDSEVNSNM